MKIRSHSERHVVELDDGSVWQIFPDDLNTTLAASNAYLTKAMRSRLRVTLTLADCARRSPAL
jgi:hypothetical protein